jgi:hypothetical protein
MKPRKELTETEFERLRKAELRKIREDQRKAKQIVEKHFSDCPRALVGEDYMFLTPKWLLNTSFISIIPHQAKNEGKNIHDRVDRIERLIRDLLTEYQQIPFQARMDGNAGWSILRLYHDFIGEAPRDIRTVDGEPLFPRKQGYLAAYRDRLSEKTHLMHHNQRDDEFAEKVNLIRAARDYWHKWRGTEAPLQASKGKYVAFVHDLIQLCEKEWSVEASMRAYRNYVRGQGNRRKS